MVATQFILHTVTMKLTFEILIRWGLCIYISENIYRNVYAYVDYIYEQIYACVV